MTSLYLDWRLVIYNISVCNIRIYLIFCRRGSGQWGLCQSSSAGLIWFSSSRNSRGLGSTLSCLKTFLTPSFNSPSSSFCSLLPLVWDSTQCYKTRSASISYQFLFRSSQISYFFFYLGQPQSRIIFYLGQPRSHILFRSSLISVTLLTRIIFDLFSIAFST